VHRTQVNQLCAIGLSTACGFGHIFDSKHKYNAREDICKHNTVTQTSATGYVAEAHWPWRRRHFHPPPPLVCFVCNIADGI
jgi:hypothetical protein